MAFLDVRGRRRGKALPALMLATLLLVTLLAPSVARAVDGVSVWDGKAVDTSWYNADDAEYKLDSAEDLAGLAKLVNDGNAFAGKTVKLVSDVDLNNKLWDPIGGVRAGGEKPFKGTFDAMKADGTNSVISNLKISKVVSSTSASQAYVGLFGLTNSPASINNVTLENVDISGGLYVGAVVGMGLTGGEIVDCHVAGTVKITGYWYVGGIGGNGYMGQLKNCSVDGAEGSYIKASGGSYAGGIWGFRGEGANVIDSCSVKGVAISAVDRVGGICGIAHYGNIIKGCSISDSTVTSSNNIGNTGLIAGADLSGADGVAKILDCTVENSTAISQGKEIFTKVGSNDHTGKPVIRQAVVGSNVQLDGTGKVTGGTLEQASAGDLAEGKVLVPNESGQFTVEGLAAENAHFTVTVGGVTTPYQTLEKAVAAANAAEGDARALIAIRASGTFAPFVITRNNVTVEAVDGVQVTFWIGETGECQVNAQGVTLKNLNYVAENGASILSFGQCDGLTLENCTFTGNGKGTALYIHEPNIVIKDCTFNDFERGYYSCGDNHAAGKMHFTGNAFTNVRVPIDGYWGKTATENTDIQIKGNTFDKGNWDASYIQLWDYAQFLKWSGSKEPDRQGSAIKATISGNTYVGDVVIYATHCDWLSDTDLTLDDGARAHLKRRHLIDLGAVESATIRNADGSAITAFNESTEAIVKDGKAYIYSISEGDYLIEAKPSAGSDALISKRVTVGNPGLNNTNTVDFGADAVPVAKVGDQAYTSLAEAIAAAKNGDTVDLLADVTVDTWKQVWDAKGLTVNGNGHKMVIGKVESASNGDYLFFGADNLTVSDLSVTFETNGNGFSLSSGKLNNVTMTGGPSSKYAVFVDSTTQDGSKVVIDGCSFTGFSGAAIYSQPGTGGAKTSDLVVNNTTIKDCGMAMCSYAQNTTFTNNTVTGGSEVSFAGAVEDANRENSYVITGNKFDSAGKIWFYGAKLEAVEFEGNKVLGNTCLYIGKKNTGKLDVSENYWGGGKPSTGSHTGQIQGFKDNVTGTDVYYEKDSMKPEDLNTYVPPVVVTTYKVSVKASDHGKVKADVSRVESGKTVTLAVTADKGFELTKLSVVDASGKNVAVTKGKNGTYTFTMPAADVTVEASFGCDGGALCPSKDFVDVDTSEWYHAAIDWAVANDVLNGIGDTGRMNPLGKLTRAQMAAILYNVEGSPAVDIAAGDEFSDFDSSAWYAKAVAWTAVKDLFQGYGTTGVFGANDVLTREQAAAVLMRWSAMNGRDVTARADLSVYPDSANVSVWAKDCMSWAVAEGMINGIPTSGGVFELRASGTATRAQAASLMMNLVDK